MIFSKEVHMIQRPILQVRIIVPLRQYAVWKCEFHQQRNRKVKKAPPQNKKKKKKANHKTIQTNDLVKSYRN